MKKTLFVLAIVATLSACGGGGSSTEQSKPTSGGLAALAPITPANAGPSSVATSAVKIAFYGDSTTAGAQTMNGRLFQTVANEPALVQTFLRQWFNRTDIVVDNQGVGGTEAGQLVNGTDGVHTGTFDQLMAASDAQIVVLNFGLNDSYYAQPQITPPAGAPRESVNDYWAYMQTLCQSARNHGKVCVFQEPNPVNGVQDKTAPIYGYVYNLRLLAQQMNAPLVKQWDGFLALPGWLGWLTEDGTHPRDEGYAWKANNTASVLIPLVLSKLQ